MAARIEEANLTGFPVCSSWPEAGVEAYQQAFEENRHRVYSLAFWMTGDELAAEELTISTFYRAFALGSDPDAERVDWALVAELRELMPLGPLTLQCSARSQAGVRHNIKRVELERAVVELPPTERMIFLLHDVERCEHARIGRLLGLSEHESFVGLHRARLRLRELLAATT